jgi:YebC/PmpR family DNA-binding regulatory protein
MSGHSKWSQIKRQKGANDAKRGALFTKLTREIITAARQGGGDVDANYRLRMAVDQARANSMPADNIKRAVERATGGGADGEQYEEITYEGFGPASVAVIVAAMTDNRNRTASDIRSAFSKSGGSLSPVAWQFEQRGLISVPLRGRDPDEVSLAAIDAGASDVSSPEAGAVVVYSEPADLESVRRALTDSGYEPDSAELSMEPTTRVAITDEKVARQVLQFVERLEDLDDVQNVYANFDIPDARGPCARACRSVRAFRAARQSCCTGARMLLTAEGEPPAVWSALAQ